jgi:PIN domain nuclease of toxin-antitoxin system
MNYVLDACAMIAVLDGEEGADIVKELFEKAEAGEVTVSMHAVNVLEVYSWRGFNTPRLCRGYKGIKPETNTL